MLDFFARLPIEFETMNLTAGRHLFYLLWLLFLLSLGHIIIHDYVCHEELHQLVSPVHHYFHNPASGSQDLLLSAAESSEKLFLPAIDPGPADFAPSIFHPPD